MIICIHVLKDLQFEGNNENLCYAMNKRRHGVGIAKLVLQMLIVF